MLLPRVAINNPQFTFTMILLMALVGIASFFTMPRSEDPQFDLPVTLIEIVYPGASPRDIETLVVDPLEQEINQLENIKKIESQIKNGGVRVVVEFIYGTEPNNAFDRVKQSVATVQKDLPDGIQDISVIKATPRSVAIMQLALWNEPTDYKTMELYAKQLEKQLEAFPDVQKATLWGYPQQVVSIDLDVNLLKHYQIALDQVLTVIKGRSINVTPGFADASERRFNIKVSGNFNSLKQLEDTIIASSEDYALRLSDVADVSFASMSPNYLAYYNKHPVIFLTLEQREGTNIFSLNEQVLNEINSYKKQLPSDFHVKVLFNQADSVELRVDGFFTNLVQGLVIVGIMSLLFLGFKESAIVILAIPLSFMIAIGWLDMANFGLQQMSIVGLIIALGLLVDNAIVVTESIHRNRNLNAAPNDVALRGVKDVGWAVTSGTVTTMLAFLPMLLLNSDTGDFMRSMPVTVVLVLLASLIIALTLTPMLASLLLTKNTSPRKFLQHYSSEFAHKFYAPFVARLLRYKTLVLVFSALMVLGLSSLFGQVGVSFFPKAEKPMLLVDVETPANSSLSYTNGVMDEISTTLQSQRMVKTVAMNVGNANPRIYYNEIPRRGESNYGQMLVILQDYEATAVHQLISSLRQKFSQYSKAKVSIKEFAQGPVTDQPITFRIMGESLAEVKKVANALEHKMHQIDGVVNINNPIGKANTELVLDINYDKAALSGIDILSLDNAVKTILSGQVVGKYNDENGEDYPILVRREVPDVESLMSITLTNNQGKQIPISHLVEFKLHQGDADFFHYQKLRMAKVSADVSQAGTVSEITQKLINFLEKHPVPMGVTFDVGGEEESRKASFGGLLQVLIITVVGIFAVLVLQFRSLLQPLIVFSAIPFALLGSVLGLYLFEQSFSIMAFIGLISLFGIVVNNAIILVDSSNNFMATGQTVQQAVANASATRFTPILLTTLTTIGGLLPLTLWGGLLWQPLGLVIISGLCVSTVSSLFIVPVLTVILTAKPKPTSAINEIIASEGR